MKIKVKLYNGQQLPKVIREGDWIDIYPTEEVRLDGPFANMLKRTRTKNTDNSVRYVEFKPKFVDLGIAMKLPNGYEAHVLPRSSAFKKWGFMLCNSQGIIDGSYKGNLDVWGAWLLPTRSATLSPDKSFLQFRITLSQKATIWQRIKWLFSTGKIEFLEVDDLKSASRGGFGSTDKQKTN